MKYAFMRANREEFDVKRMCKVLQISRSGYYDWQGVKSLSAVNRTCSAQGDPQDPSGDQGGLRCNQDVVDFKTIRDGMRQASSGTATAEAGIEALRKRKFRLAYQSPQHGACSTESFTLAVSKPAFPDQIWVTDVTFIPTRSGWLYLAVMIDLHTRLVVGWSMKDRPNQELVNEALMMAVEQRRPKPGLIHHSDQGILYSSGQLYSVAEKYGMLRSMSGKGNCYDNAVAESFFSSLKNELVHHRDYQTRDEARTEIFEYIELFYNRKRLHQSLNYQPPMKYKSVKVSPN